MSVIYGLDCVSPEVQECAVAIGVFDGVHWGHRSIFRQLTEIAEQKDIKSTALTFDKHPSELLAPTRAPYYICTLDQRIEYIELAGVDCIVVAQFSPWLANLPKDEFITSILVEKLKARHIIVGSNFRFGKNRDGDIRYLESVSSEFNIGVSVVPSVVIDGGPASSTRIREMIRRGDIEDAAKLLGRKFTLRGTVVMGRQIGRTIGFPTANIRTEPRQLVPARGVYAVEVNLAHTAYTGVCNIGCRPTFDAGAESIEVHLASFQGDIYGETLDIAFCRRLRDEMVFESPESLAQQIRRDVERASGTC